MTYVIISEQPLNEQAWEYLSAVLDRVGLDPQDAELMHVVDTLPFGVNPSASQIKEGGERLLSSLFNLNVPALLLGNVPLKATTGRTGIKDYRGIQDGITATLYATLSVGSVMNVPNYRHEWIRDISAFQQLVNPAQETVYDIIVEDQDTFDDFVSEVKPTGAVDIETTIEEDPWVKRPELVSVAVTFDGTTAYVFRNDRWLEDAKPFLEEVDWTMHNGGFDRLMMHLYGYDLTLKHDTMAMAYLLHEEDRKGLEILSSVYLGLPPYKGVDYENILDEPFEKVARMNAVDACRTLRLFRPLADELNKNKDFSRLYQWVLMPAVNTLIRVTENGIPIDTDRLDTLSEKLHFSSEQITAKLQEMAPEPDPEVYPKGWPKKNKVSAFNPGSSKQVGHILFEQWGLPVVKETATGNPSTDAEALTELQIALDPGSVAGEFVETLLASRKVSKQVSSYIESWPKFIVDGRMHPRYKPLHVVTGRLSSEKPNIQQVPRDKEFRDIFGGVEGYTWMKADYSQIELRLAAWAAGETSMLEAFTNGEDLHAKTAEMVLGKGGKDARSVGKVLNFGLLYGAGWNTLRRIARTDYGMVIKEKDAKRYRDQFFQAYPALQRWHTNMENDIINSGQAISPLGRVRHLPEAQSWDNKLASSAVRQGINHPIQSFASDILLKSLSRVQERLDEGGFEAQIIAEVHDEMDLLVPDHEVDAVAALVKETMEDISWLEKWGINLTVPVVADVEVGTHWGSINDWSTS